MEDYRGKFNRPDKNGEYTYNNFQGDIDCYTKVPNNLTPNTPTIIHEHGARVDWVWYDSQKLALDRNATCIFPASMTRDPINALETTYREVLGTSSNKNDIILTGHSAGGPATLKALVTMYKEGNAPSEPPLVVMLDGSFKNCKLTSEEVAILAENKVPIIAYYQLDQQKQNYETLGQNGINIALIRDYDCHGHDAPSINFFNNEKGLYDFVCGKGELLAGNSGHQISVWSNGEEKYTNEGNPSNITGANTRDKIYLMMGIYTYEFKIQQLKALKPDISTNLAIQTNNNLFDLNIRYVMTNISNTSYISSNNNYSVTQSSSQTISKISDLTGNYFETTTDLLFSIVTELQEYKKISPAFDYVENKMNKNTMELNNLIHKENIEFKEYQNPFKNNQQYTSSNGAVVKEL